MPEHECLYERQWGALETTLQNMNGSVTRIESTLIEVRDETLKQRGQIDQLEAVIRNGSGRNSWGRAKKIGAGGGLACFMSILGYVGYLMIKVLETLP